MNPKAEVTSVIEQFFKALDTQDFELMMDLLPHDDESMVHIGTDSDEIWTGWTDLSDATKQQFQNLEYYKANIYNLNISLSQSGEVAWYFHRLDADIKSGDQITHWERARFTGVLEKHCDRWLMAQTHVSIPE